MSTEPNVIIPQNDCEGCDAKDRMIRTLSIRIDELERELSTSKPSNVVPIRDYSTSAEPWSEKRTNESRS